MGEIADMMLDGTLCEACGEFTGDGFSGGGGFPRRCGGCEPQPRHMPKRRVKAVRSAFKMLRRQQGTLTPEHILHIARRKGFFKVQTDVKQGWLMDRCHILVDQGQLLRVHADTLHVLFRPAPVPATPPTATHEGFSL